MDSSSLCASLQIRFEALSTTGALSTGESMHYGWRPPNTQSTLQEQTMASSVSLN